MGTKKQEHTEEFKRQARCGIYIALAVFLVLGHWSLISFQQFRTMARGVNDQSFSTIGRSMPRYLFNILILFLILSVNLTEIVVANSGEGCNQMLFSPSVSHNGSTTSMNINANRSDLDLGPNPFEVLSRVPEEMRTLLNYRVEFMWSLDFQIPQLEGIVNRMIDALLQVKSDLSQFHRESQQRNSALRNFIDNRVLRRESSFSQLTDRVDELLNRLKAIQRKGFPYWPIIEASVDLSFIAGEVLKFRGVKMNGHYSLDKKKRDLAKLREILLLHPIVLMPTFYVSKSDLTATFLAGVHPLGITTEPSRFDGNENQLPIFLTLHDGLLHTKLFIELLVPRFRISSGYEENSYILSDEVRYERMFSKLQANLSVSEKLISSDGIYNHLQEDEANFLEHLFYVLSHELLLPVTSHCEALGFDKSDNVLNALLETNSDLRHNREAFLNYILKIFPFQNRDGGQSMSTGRMLSIIDLTKDQICRF